MPTLDWRQRACDGVTLVEAVVTGETREQVRVENRLDGPVWPPRAEGVPAPGWDESGYEGVVTGDERLVVGYASPAPPAEPPVELAAVSSAPDSGGVTAREIVHALGDGRPPRDALPDGGANLRAESNDAAERAGETAVESAPDTEQGAEEWFAAVEQRLATAQRLADASSVAEAERAVAAAGGVSGMRGLRARLETDRERLAELEGRAGELEGRIRATDVPVETLARVV
jgi:hypothetical protein